MGTVFVAEHTTNGAQHTTGQREAGRQQRGDADVQTVLTHVVLHHPQRQRHVATKHNAVVLAVLEHLGILECLELVGELDMAGYQVCGVAVAEKPEQHHGAQHDGRIHLGHHGPAKRHQNDGGHKLVHSGTRVARTVDTHGRALAILGKPACHVGCAHRERTTCQTHKQANRQKVPVFGGVTHHPDGGHRDQHEDGHHNTSTKPVGPDA